jgi:PAS domain S-box-containing protein
MDPLIVRRIVENMPIGLMVIDPAGKIVVANEALRQILELSTEELGSKGWGELFIKEDRNLEFNQTLIDVILKEVENLQRRASYETPSGQVKQLSVTSSYLTDENQLVGIVLLVEDVTERHRMHQRETRMLSAMHQLQVERTEGLNKLALSVAHQIRNPMSTIGGFAHMLLRNTKLEPDAEQNIRIILSELRKLENLVRVVAEYASIPQARTLPVRVNTLIENAFERLERIAEERGRLLRLSLNCGPEMEAAVDPSTFPGALDAILLNALEAASESVKAAEIEVFAEYGAGGLRIRVRDFGAGVAATDLPYVFDPFFTTKPQAVGMGLCMAKRVALEHQGEIFMISEQGEGAEVTLRAPLK